MSFEIGDQPGGYLLLSRCGRGAYGEVFQARNVVTGKLFALKVFPGNGTQSEREQTGIIRYQTLAEHSQLLQIYHVGVEDGRFFYVMDLADDLGGEGGAYLPDTLQNRIDRNGRIPVSELRQIANDVAEDLTLLHKKGLFHRDIKPGNIVFINGRATLGDIGLVTSSGASTLVGTAGFLSPEVLAGTRPFAEADDFYALGRTIYCALTGNPPEKYPEFPAELDLKSARDIVSLYNFWCAGNCDLPIFPAKPGRARRRFTVILLIVALSAAFPIAIFWWSHSKVLTGPMYWEELQSLSKTYLPPDDFLLVLPKLKDREHDLKLELVKIETEAYNAPVREEDILLVAKQPGKADDPEYRIRIERRDAAGAAFLEAHRSDPALEFFDIENQIGVEVNRIKYLKDNPYLHNYDFSNDLRNIKALFARRQEVIESILKEYSAAGKAKK